jgi:polysaccharide export outer membrane protein
MRGWGRRSGALAGLLVVVYVGSACVGVPKFQPQYVGLGDLPLQKGERDLPPYANATNLPRLPSPDAEAARPAYRLGPLDKIVVVVWGRDDLGSQVPVGVNGQLRASVVREDGTISLPFLGQLEVAGKTVEQVRDLVQSRYARLVESPQVEVELHECASRSVELSGAIAQTGRVFLCDNIVTLGDVLATARGPMDTADLVRGLLTREGHPYHLDYSKALGDASAAAEIIMQHGDRVRFPFVEERLVYIFGEVNRQGAFPIPAEGLTLLGTLAQARGLDTVTSKHKGIYLMRRKDTGVVGYKLTIAELLEGPEIPMAAEDRVYVSMSPLERWDRWWRKALPFTTVRTDIQVGGDE